jgi:hypothetical protein
MAKEVTFKNGVSMLIGRLTLAQEREFYRISGGGPIAWHRGSAANLGPAAGADPREPSPDPAQPSPRKRV